MGVFWSLMTVQGDVYIINADGFVILQSSFCLRLIETHFSCTEVPSSNISEYVKPNLS